MHFQLGPLSVSLIQLVLVAGGTWMGLLIWNTVVKNGWSKVTASVLAVPVIWLFLFVAFFKISELTLLPFIAKIVRNRFLDTTKKIQTNDTKIDPLEILIKSSHATYEDKEKQEKKTLSIEDITKKSLSSDELLS